MAPINSIASSLGKIIGSSAKVTLGQKQLLQLTKSKLGDKAAENIGKLLSKYPNAKATVAYKASERGFTVGALQIKNGKDVIANGAVSVTGLGGKNAPLIKGRLNIGKNGEVLSSKGWIDFRKPPKLQDIEMATSLKKGVLNMSSAAGKASNSYLKFDTVKATEALGIKAEAGEFVNMVNNMYAKIHKNMTKLYTGEIKSSKEILKDLKPQTKKFDALADKMHEALKKKWF